MFTGPAEIATVAPGVFVQNAGALALGNVLRVAADGSQAVESVAATDDAGNVVPAPIDLGSDDEQVYLLLYTTGLRFRAGDSSVTVQIGDWMRRLCRRARKATTPVSTRCRCCCRANSPGAAMSLSS
jgi:hypothetical protein